MVPHALTCTAQRQGLSRLLQLIYTLPQNTQLIMSSSSSFVAIPVSTLFYSTMHCSHHGQSGFDLFLFLIKIRPCHYTLCFRPFPELYWRLASSLSRSIWTKRPCLIGPLQPPLPAPLTHALPSSIDCRHAGLIMWIDHISSGSRGLAVVLLLHCMPSAFIYGLDFGKFPFP